jgi:hypothetical protein
MNDGQKPEVGVLEEALDYLVGKPSAIFIIIVKQIRIGGVPQNTLQVSVE